MGFWGDILFPCDEERGRSGSQDLFRHRSQGEAPDGFEPLMPYRNECGMTPPGRVQQHFSRTSHGDLALKLRMRGQTDSRSLEDLTGVDRTLGFQIADRVPNRVRDGVEVNGVAPRRV